MLEEKKAHEPLKNIINIAKNITFFSDSTIKENEEKLLKKRQIIEVENLNINQKSKKKKIENKNDSNIFQGKYFQYDYETEEFSLIPGKRPNNQRKKKILRRISGRLKELLNKNKNIQLTGIQKLFIQIVEENKFKLKENDIHMAHNISIHIIMEAFLDLLNNPSELTDEVDNEFLDHILSSDDEEKKEKNKNRLKGLKYWNLSIEEKIKWAEILIEEINQKSKNLYPGHPRTNSSIGDLKDTPIIFEGDEAKEVPYAKKVSKYTIKFLEEHSCENYRSKTKIEENEEKIQSSSINQSPSKSYVKLN